jgi:hypothetical protein
LNGEVDDSFSSVYSQINRMLTGPKIRMRSVTTKTHNYIFNIDRQYPGKLVDGWGFHNTLPDLNKRFYLRAKEELCEYNKLNSKVINDDQIQTNMFNVLLEYMRLYNDPLYSQILRSKIKFV